MLVGLYRDSMRTGDKMTTLVESVKPFKVRASCGHVVIRKMREATAGVPYTPETILDAPNGRACDACEIAQAEGLCILCQKPVSDKDRTIGGRVAHEDCYLRKFAGPIQEVN